MRFPPRFRAALQGRLFACPHLFVGHVHVSLSPGVSFTARPANGRELVLHPDVEAGVPIGNQGRETHHE